jgi:hypothetical protein
VRREAGSDGHVGCNGGGEDGASTRGCVVEKCPVKAVVDQRCAQRTAREAVLTLDDERDAALLSAVADFAGYRSCTASESRANIQGAPWAPAKPLDSILWLDDVAQTQVANWAPNANAVRRALVSSRLPITVPGGPSTSRARRESGTGLGDMFRV